MTTPPTARTASWGSLADRVAGHERVAALVGPHLQPPGETFDHADLLTDADAHDLVDALHAAGVLVFDKTGDRAHLRARWAALTDCLDRISDHRDVEPLALEQLPAAHRNFVAAQQARLGMIRELSARIDTVVKVINAVLGTTAEGIPMSDEMRDEMLNSARGILRGSLSPVDHDYALVELKVWANKIKQETREAIPADVRREIERDYARRLVDAAPSPYAVKDAIEMEEESHEAPPLGYRPPADQPHTGAITDEPGAP